MSNKYLRTASDHSRVVELVNSEKVPLRRIEQMALFFSRHDKDTTPSQTWASWGGDAGKAWAARVLATRNSEAPTLAHALAEEDAVDYDTLKLLPRAFCAMPNPHEASCAGDGSCACGGSRDSGKFPSERAITFAALGGSEAAKWAGDVVRRVETKALMAAAAADADVEEEGEDTSGDFPPDESHVFTPIPVFPVACVFCTKGETDEVHAADAVDYSIADIDPASAHYPVDPEGSGQCKICEQPIDGELHKQAALAAYYQHKEQWDKQFAETQQYWAGKEQGISAAGSFFGVDWTEGELPSDEALLLDHVADVDEAMEEVAWQPRNEFDPITFYVAFSGDDHMSVDQVYVADGPLLYKYDPYQRFWAQSSPKSTEQIYEVDLDTAHSVIRALSTYPALPVDLREVDPGEALMMEEALPYIEQDLDQLDRYVVVTASGSVFAEEYTPEERAANARKQVRDRAGRFAKSGSRVMGPKGAGTVARIDPDTQSVELKYDGGEAEWVSAKEVAVVPPQQPAEEHPYGQDPNADIELRRAISNIPGKPRATANTPKARLSQLLQPMNAETLQKVISDYEAQVAEDRAKADKIENWEEIAGTPEEQEAERRRRRRDDAIVTVSSANEWRKAHGFATEEKAASGEITGPETSDVKPLYMAVVDEADSQAVLDLLALTPASTTTTDAVIWRRVGGGWEKDDSMLRKLRSSAPPPVVQLDEAMYADTVAQVDAFFASEEGQQTVEDTEAAPDPAAAAVYGEYGELLPPPQMLDPALLASGIPGIADTPEDIANVARLKRYWLVGEGAAKIGWNTPGDMTRCMRQLNKYMRKPGMAEGYCAKLHKEATGVWPGDRRNVGRVASGVPSLFERKFLTSKQVIEFSALIAAAQASEDQTAIPMRGDEVPTEMTGAPFVIPLVAPVGVKSGDGRSFSPLALSMRDLPLPLLWQVQTQDGHDASVIVGRIDSIDRAEDGSLRNARGVFDVGPYGQEAERLVRHKFLRGTSVDLDEFEAEARAAQRDEDDVEEMGVVKIKPDEMTITNGRVMGITLVAKPAFQECVIYLDEEEEEVEDMADGTYIGTPATDAETEEMVRSALVAAGVPLNPPVAWFDNPKLGERTPLTIEDDGRVFGHIATWDREHIGLPFSTTPPKSRSNYAYFHTGVLRTEEGVDVPVGQITLAGGHADLNASAQMAVKHYDDTASAMCDVHCGEDEFGIWVAGALRPSVTSEQIRAIRASAPSGDWRPINGRLELVAICQVNVPGFPITRARVASGHVYALVAAGTSTLNEIRRGRVNNHLDALLERVERLEAPQREALAHAREAAVARVSAVRSERAAKARERFSSLQSSPAQFKQYSSDKLEEFTKKGWAIRNHEGEPAYPIADAGDLKNAIRAYGRAASQDRAKVRRHIQKRAKALGKTDVIPESWKSLSAMHEEVADALTTALLAAGGRYPNGEPWDPNNHPRDEKGRFRQVIAQLRSDLEGEAGTADAVEKLDEAEQAERVGDTDAAQQAAQEVLNLVDEIAGKSADPDVVNTLREGYGNLAEAVANLPLAFGDLNQKYRFTDLPEELQGLIEDLYGRAERILDNEDLSEAGGKLSEFMAGGDVLSQPDISSELSKLLRFLI
jgi:hypothetical protein